MSGYINLQLFLLRILFGGMAVGCGMGAFEIAGQLYSIPSNQSPLLQKGEFKGT